MNAESKSIGHFLSATAMALALAGCDSGAPVDAPAAPRADAPAAMGIPTPYEKDVMALKSGESDPDRIRSGIQALRSRHGIPAGPIAPLSPADSPEEEESHVLAKAAATKYFVPRTRNFFYEPTPEVTIPVPANATVEAWTTRDSDNEATDPVMVGFFRTSGDENSQAYTTRFIGFADDSDGLNPKISWKNTSGTGRNVRFVAFAYDEFTKGTVTIHYKIVGKQMTSLKRPLRATRIPVGLPNTQGCTGPSRTRLGLQRVSGQFWDNVALAYNDVTKRGGYIVGISTLIFLEDVLPTTGDSFLIGYSGYAADGIVDGNTYKASQLDTYSCTP